MLFPLLDILINYGGMEDKNLFNEDIKLYIDMKVFDSGVKFIEWDTSVEESTLTAKLVLWVRYFVGFVNLSFDPILSILIL